MIGGRRYDVIITGAGAVGATLGLALAHSGRRVALLDTRPGPTEHPGDAYTGFVVALNRASLALLDRLSIWPNIRDFRVSPYVAMELRDAAGSGSVRFDSADIGEPLLGYFVETALLESVLHRALQSCADITAAWGERPVQLDIGRDSASLQTEKGVAWSAPLIVGADGARSQLRELAGIEVDVHPYDQHALVCNFATEADHGAVARQRFLPGGPVAMLPLADGRCSLAWFRPDAEVEGLLGLDEAAFCERLTEATGNWLGAVTAAEPPRAFPIIRRHARDYTAERVVLVGDAAHAIHPLAGQGLNLGMLDVAALAECVGTEGDPGARLRLRRYARWRRTHNTAVMALMDGFHYGFAFGSPLQQTARNLIMNAANAVGPVRRQFIRHGAGLSGDLPPLARPSIARFPSI